MPCTIAVYVKDHRLFPSKVISLTNIEEVKKVFLALDHTYPEQKGFELRIRRLPDERGGIDRSNFRKACQSDDWRDLINCFVFDDEFRSFCQLVTFMNI